MYKNDSGPRGHKSKADKVGPPKASFQLLYVSHSSLSLFSLFSVVFSLRSLSLFALFRSVLAEFSLAFLQVAVLREYFDLEFAAAFADKLPPNFDGVGYDIERVIDDFIFMCGSFLSFFLAFCAIFCLFFAGCRVSSPISAHFP